MILQSTTIEKLTIQETLITGAAADEGRVPATDVVDVDTDSEAVGGDVADGPLVGCDAGVAVELGLALEVGAFILNINNLCTMACIRAIVRQLTAIFGPIPAFLEQKSTNDSENLFDDVFLESFMNL